MRFSEMVWNDKEEVFEDQAEKGDAIVWVDYKECADIILEIIDDQLAPFDLEIVQYDVKQDAFAWCIRPRSASAERGAVIIFVGGSLRRRGQAAGAVGGSRRTGG